MAISRLAPALLAAAAAAAVAFAPPAAADDRDGPSRPGRAAAEDRDGASRPGPVRPPQQRDVVKQIPKGWTNEAMWARPGPGGSNPFGTLPKPPVFALD